MTRVLITANCPDATDDVTSYARELKKQKPETKFTVTSVARPVVKAGSTSAALFDIPVHLADLESKMYAESVHYAQRAIDRTLAKFREAGLTASSVLLMGEPHTEIVRYADRKNVDEIVYGACKPNLIQSIFGDDPACAVAANAGRPVTVIRPE